MRILRRVVVRSRKFNTSGEMAGGILFRPNGFGARLIPQSRRTKKLRSIDFALIWSFV